MERGSSHKKRPSYVDSPFYLSRDNKDDESTADNIDEILKQHHDMQEKVAEEMILMTQSMKQTSLRSREIIKKDKMVKISLFFYYW